MRLLFRSLAFLDVVSLVFMAMQLWQISHHINEINQLSAKVQAVLMFPMFVLVLVGAIGLWLGKKFGLILYYTQFPFRLYLWVFTVGFITLLPEALSNFEDYWFSILLKVCMTAEFIRLYLTVSAHLKFRNRELR